MNRRWCVRVGLAVFAAVWMTCDVQAETAAALVVEKRGASEPEFAPYSEIPIASSVSLSPGTTFVFVHYGTCRTVTVLGGKVTFQALTYSVTGESSSQEIPTPCPRTVRLKGAGETTGITLRSSPASFELSTTPTFLLIGPAAGDFATIRVSQADRVLLDAPLAGRSFHWPMGTAPLAANADYEMTLVPRAVGQTPMTVKFRVEASTAAASDHPLTLIRIEQ